MFEIILDHLVIKKNGLSCDVFGTIFVRTKDFSFPYDGWTDFGSPIVLWWEDEFRKMNEQGLNQCELTFMDVSFISYAAHPKLKVRIKPMATNISAFIIDSLSGSLCTSNYDC